MEFENAVNQTFSAMWSVMANMSNAIRGLQSSSPVPSSANAAPSLPCTFAPPLLPSTKPLYATATDITRVRFEEPLDEEDGDDWNESDLEDYYDYLYETIVQDGSLTFDDSEEFAFAELCPSLRTFSRKRYCYLVYPNEFVFANEYWSLCRSLRRFSWKRYCYRTDAYYDDLYEDMYVDMMKSDVMDSDASSYDFECSDLYATEVPYL